MSALPSDDPLDAKRRRRVDLTRPEILAQPQAIRATLAGARDATVEAAGALARAGIRRIVMTGCGNSLAVMIAARLFFEQLLGMSCEPVQALDVAYYGYRTIDATTLLVTLSSSGMTTRTVEALLVARALGARTLALSNTAGSPLMAEAEHSLMIRAERKGWPTQASAAALALLLQFGLNLARALGRKPALVDAWQQALDGAPEQIETVLAGQEAATAEIAEREAERPFYLYAGGGPSYAAALFGAAKVKECTPDHALAIPLEEYHPLQFAKSRRSAVPGCPGWAVGSPRAGHGLRRPAVGRADLRIVTEGQAMLDEHCDEVLRLPSMPGKPFPLVYAVPLQLFAYHVAMAKFRHAEATGRTD